MPDVRPRLLNRTIAFTGRVFRVESDQIELANGVVTTLDIARHRGSVVLIPLPSPTTIVLIRQYRHAIGQWIWEVPAGSLEPGEDPETAAKRECAEEIGQSVGRITRVGAFYPTPGFCDELMVFYRLEQLTRLTSPVAQDADEQIEPRTFALDEARALLQHSEYADMKTTLALTLV